MNASIFDYPRWAMAHRAKTEAALAAVMPAQSAMPQRLHEAMRYSTLGGGKRIRALLAYGAYDCALNTCGAELLNANENPNAVDSVACAVEMIHAYSLIHDDLPCMDDDVLRRGQPTCHVRFDESTALLAGDALQPLAFELLTSTALSDARKVALIATLATASGSAGMAGGQAIDLAGVGKKLSVAELETMHRLKTGALIQASVTMGALCCEQSAPQVLQRLNEYSRALGLAFQVTDDILDVEGTAEALGKTAGKDAADEKPTYVTLLGLAAAKKHASELTQGAHDALAPLGAHASALRGIADEVLRRRN